MANYSLKVRPFTAADEAAVIEMDKASGNCVAQWVNEDDLPNEKISDYAYGIFENETLIGYATIGYADDCPEDIENTPCYHNEQLMLSDVYVLPEKRHNGYATRLCMEAMLYRFALESENTDHVYAALLNDNLIKFYGKLGFKWCNQDNKEYYIMVSKADIESIVAEDKELYGKAYGTPEEYSENSYTTKDTMSEYAQDMIKSVDKGFSSFCEGKTNGVKTHTILKKDPVIEGVYELWVKVGADKNSNGGKIIGKIYDLNGKDEVEKALEEINNDSAVLSTSKGRMTLKDAIAKEKARKKNEVER